MIPRLRRGFFLIIVMVVIAVATFAAYSFTELMLAYYDSSDLSADIVQARMNVESGSEMCRLVLTNPPESRVDMGGVYNNPQLFQGIVASMGIDGVTPSNFTVIAPGLDELGRYGGIRFGLQNESARLNVNALPILEKYSDALMPMVALTSGELDEDSELDSENIAVSLLMSLPNMTEDIAEAILDWLDEDEIARDYGAEVDYYGTLPTPYEPANGPLKSVDDLLLVKGVTPTLLFGADANRNGVIDGDEQQRFGVSIDTAGALGWSAYLTVHGSEANKTRAGEFRVNVNQSDMELLYEELSTALGNDLYASFIVAYRIAGQSSSTAATINVATGNNRNPQSQAEPGGPWTTDLLDEMDLTGGGGTSLNQVLDLIDSTVTIGSGENAKSYTSPFPGDPISMAIYLPIIMDLLSTQDVDQMPGRININECPAELLYGIPLLSEESVEAILEARSTDSDDPNRSFETWPMAEGILTVDEMRALLPLVTCGGDVYRAQIVGYFETVAASHRAEVIIDATTVNPKVVSWRDFSHLGRGFDIAVLGLRGGVVATAGSETDTTASQ